MALARSFGLFAAPLNHVTRQAVSIRPISVTATNREWGDKYVPPAFKDWKECPPDFKENPERDLENFPRPPKYIFTPKVRLGFISESFFDFFYKKTGVTGPYVFGLGVFAFLVNKEYYIICTETQHAVAFIGVAWIMNKMFSGMASQAYDEYYNKEDYQLREWAKNSNQNSKQNIEKSKDIVARCEGWSDAFFQAQRDQIYLQMEEAYRKRLLEGQSAVKRRMDYLVAFDEAKKQYQRRHIVDWVVDQVKKSITDQTQKAAFTQCLANLKTLSAKAQI